MQMRPKRIDRLLNPNERIQIPGGRKVLREILAGGQSFLWGEVQNNRWRGVHLGKAYEVDLDGDNMLTVSCLTPGTDYTSEAISQYFGCQKPFLEYSDSLPWRSDKVLEQAIRGFPGLRILRQCPEVTLLSFLLSPQKRIEQIRVGLLKISSNWGDSILEGLYAPPSWDRLSTVEEIELRSCGIGYRAKSIARTARFLADHPGYLHKIESLPTEEARERLLQLPGVGRKIADCVLLFSYGRLESFPIDTWIGRFMRESYGLDDYTDDQIQTFARAHFGENAGLAQQYFFAAARNG